MGFQQGLSGLNASSKTLEAIGNNVANANTVGFKASQAQFADMFAASLTGAGSSQVGIGVKVAQVAQSFTQGNVTASNNPLDIAINGGGFFRMSNNGTITYGRNGQFQLDKTGFIVNASGARLTGYTASGQGVLSTGAPSELKIAMADLPPAETGAISAQLNLNSSQKVPTNSPFSLTDPTTYNNSTSVSVFDSLGNSHVVQTYYVKTATAGQWDVYGATDDTLTVTAPVGGKIGALIFGTDGQINAATIASLPFSVAIPAGQGAAAFTPKLDYTGTTQFGSAFSVNALQQDGYASGRLSGFAAGPDGTLTGRYTNGKSATLGQIVLANFTDPNGLQPLGNNVWAETATSGPALVGAPDTGALGVLQSSAVEDSNVDLTAELVNMITAQRVYQANAQTIKTEDQMLQTLVNLR
jgi:flagellar hook protein FlgE